MLIGVVDQRRVAHRVGRTARDGDFGHVELLQFAVRRVDVITDGDGFVVIVGVAGDDLQVEHAELAPQRVGHQCDLEVGDRTPVLVIEVAVFEERTLHSLAVDRQAPGVHQHAERVDPLPHVGRQVELRGGQRVVDLGHGPVVEPERVAGARIFEVEEDATVGPFERDVDLRAVEGADLALGTGDQLGTEGHPVASGLAVAGIGVVAGVVGDHFGAEDAAALGQGAGCGFLLGSSCQRAGCQRSRP